MTDVFLGTYIWLSDPIQIAKMNEMQIMSQAYGFFRDKEWYTPIIGYITTTCTILPIIMAIALLAFGLVKEKSVSMLGIINSFLDSRREAKLTKLGFSSEEYNELQKRMNNV